MAKRKFKFGDVVRIEWRDASGYSGWLYPDELKEDGAMVTATIGHFVKQSKYGIYLSAAGLMKIENEVRSPKHQARNTKYALPAAAVPSCATPRSISAFAHSYIY